MHGVTSQKTAWYHVSSTENQTAAVNHELYVGFKGNIQARGKECNIKQAGKNYNAMTIPTRSSLVKFWSPSTDLNSPQDEFFPFLSPILLLLN